MGLNSYLRFVKRSVFIDSNVLIVRCSLSVRDYNCSTTCVSLVGNDSLSKLLKECNKSLILDYLNKVYK